MTSMNRNYENLGIYYTKLSYAKLTIYNNIMCAGIL